MADALRSDIPHHPNTQRSIFKIPLSTQRYDWVKNFLLAQQEITTVTDFGCGNGRIVHWLKAVPHLTSINFVDIDDVLLDLESDYHIQPNFHEMLFGRQYSKESLAIRVYHGDISTPDERLLADCFLLVELIEHLHLDTFERATRTVFGYYQPRFVVVTTPNIEFNFLLNRTPEERTKFRHHDHKFEWTRAQFSQWSQEICKRFPYEVDFDGVGHLPDSDPYGPCTQIAIFRRDDHRKQDREDRDLSCFDAMLDKLNVKESVKEWQIDPKQNKVSLLNEFLIRGQTPDPNDNQTSDDFDWTADNIPND